MSASADPAGALPFRLRKEETMPKKKKEAEVLDRDETRIALEKESAEAGEILALVKAYEITDQPSMDLANESLGEVKARLKWIEAKRKEATGPMLAALEAVRSWFRPAEQFYKDAERVWKDKIGAYFQVQAEAQARALAAVQSAHDAGDARAVAQAMTKAVSADVEMPRNVSVVKRWDFEIVHPDAVPRDMCGPDPAKIRAAVNLTDGAIEIPGVRIFRSDTVVQRRA